MHVFNFNCLSFIAQEERVSISKIYIHENYNPRTTQNDIALLILDKKVKLTGEVQVGRIT